MEQMNRDKKPFMKRLEEYAGGEIDTTRSKSAPKHGMFIGEHPETTKTHTRRKTEVRYAQPDKENIPEETEECGATERVQHRRLMSETYQNHKSLKEEE